MDIQMLETFLKNHGCNVAAKDFIAYVSSKTEGEINDDDIAAVAGGIYHREGVHTSQILIL